MSIFCDIPVMVCDNARISFSKSALEIASAHTVLDTVPTVLTWPLETLSLPPVTVTFVRHVRRAHLARYWKMVSDSIEEETLLSSRVFFETVLLLFAELDSLTVEVSWPLVSVEDSCVFLRFVRCRFGMALSLIDR
ncbi:hypothetical protein BaRGS_00040307 [Batillaria attramentaria]|uniref:Uncharacterized protein n=1 Tax=Batillaria attramentaria TaxID=370345 RepID=A0ABD0J1B4_9CAEN